jgi:hypothetical protein
MKVASRTDKRKKRLALKVEEYMFVGKDEDGTYYMFRFNGKGIAVFNRDYD